MTTAKSRWRKRYEYLTEWWYTLGEWYSTAKHSAKTQQIVISITDLSMRKGNENSVRRGWTYQLKIATLYMVNNKASVASIYILIRHSSKKSSHKMKNKGRLAKVTSLQSNNNPSLNKLGKLNSFWFLKSWTIWSDQQGFQYTCIFVSNIHLSLTHQRYYSSRRF